MIRVWVMIGLVVAVLGALVLQQQQKVGQLKEQLGATERALQQTTQAMQQLDQMYQAADQQLVINRRQHQQINQQLRGQVDALRSELATDVRAAACIPDAVADRLRSITSTADTGLRSSTGNPDRAYADPSTACYSYSDVVSYVPELVAAIQQCNADKASIRSINDTGRTE